VDSEKIGRYAGALFGAIPGAFMGYAAGGVGGAIGGFVLGYFVVAILTLFLAQTIEIIGHFFSFFFKSLFSGMGLFFTFIIVVALVSAMLWGFKL
jgi:hypothetical protein